MSKYGEGVEEPSASGGVIIIEARAVLSPDEARLLGLRLIKMADEAEGQEW